MALIGKAGFDRNLRERFLRVGEPAGDVLNPRSDYRIGDRVTAEAAKGSAEVRRMDSGLRRERCEIEWLPKSFAHCGVGYR